MHKKSFGFILFILILAIAVFHNIAMASYIYWRYLWTDLVVHFLSGFWIALVGFWIFRFWGRKPFQYSISKLLFATLFLAVIVGVCWEVFEYSIGIVEYSSRYTTDTILDIVMDILGGTVGFLVVLWYEKKIDKLNNSENYES